MREIDYYTLDTNFDYIIINSEMYISENVFKLLEDEYDRIINQEISLEINISIILYYQTIKFKSPVNLYRLIHSTQKKFNIVKKIYQILHQNM